MITRGTHTGGSACEVELLVRPHAPGFYTGFAGSTPYHSHSQEETIAVQEGLLAYTLAGQQGTAAAGDVLTVPAGGSSEQPAAARIASDAQPARHQRGCPGIQAHPTAYG